MIDYLKLYRNFLYFINMLSHCFYWMCSSSSSDGGVTTTSTWTISCCLYYTELKQHENKLRQPLK